jgi:hypothetical protein
MTLLHTLYGNQFGLDHRQLAAGEPDPQTSGYTGEVSYLEALVSKVTITSAQLLALNATAQTIVPAAPTGFVNVFLGAAIYKPAGTAYAGIAAGEDLVVKATNAAGQQQSSVIETTGFLDQATAQLRYVYPIASTSTTAADITPLNAALVLHLLVGEIITGTSDLIVHTYVRRLPTVLTV